MNKITHLKRYEKVKKQKHYSKNNIQYVSNQNDYGIVVETNYHKAFILYNNKIKEYPLSNNLPYICNKIIFPGDKVTLNKDEITGIIKRTNILSRNKKDYTSKKVNIENHIIATNIDLAIIVVSAKDPDLHPKLIDRYIIILKNSNIPFIICLNKKDLLSNEESILSIYSKLGIPLIKTSTYTKEGLLDLLNILEGKQTILIGHSGVGKSSLINALLDEYKTKIGNTSKGKGCHTTTKSKYYKINNNTSIIDTPGIRSIDLSYYNKEEIKDYFIEFTPYNKLCKYQNCLHYNEPLSTCYIKRLVKDNLISKERYESYLKIIKELS